MTKELVVDTPVVSKNVVDVGITTPTTVCAIDPSTTVEGYKKEYTIVGDKIYIGQLESPPAWLIKVIDQLIVDTITPIITTINDDINGLSNDVNDLGINSGLLVASVRDALDALGIAENAYTQWNSIEDVIDERIGIALQALNTTLGENTSQIADLYATRVTSSEASALAVQQIESSINGGAIGSEITNIQNTIANNELTTALSIEALSSVINDPASGVYANANAIETLLTRVTNTEEGVTATAGRISEYDIYMRGNNGEIGAADSSLVNTIDGKITEGLVEVDSKFEYNSTLKIGSSYYYSGFGLVSTGSGGTEGSPTFNSEFWINAEKLRVRSGSTDYIKWDSSTGRLKVEGDIYANSFYVDGGIFTDGSSGSVTNIRLGVDTDSRIGVFGRSNHTYGVGVYGMGYYSFYGMGQLFNYGNLRIFDPDGNGEAGSFDRGYVRAQAGFVADTYFAGNIACFFNKDSSDPRGGYFQGSQYGVGGYSPSTYGGYFQCDNTTTGYDAYLVNSRVGPFTAGHDALVSDYVNYELGDIAVDIEMLDYSNMNNTLFKVRKSTNSNDKPVGVFAGIPTDRIPTVLNKTNTSLPDDYKTTIVNAVGEGMMNVCGQGGDLSNGDLIQCSDTAGKGMRQNKSDGTPDDTIRNITVAKARGNWTFDNPNEVKLVPCIYVCG